MGAIRRSGAGRALHADEAAATTAARGAWMRRGPTALALSVSLWLCAAEIALAQQPSAERPTYEVGMRWLLNDGAYDLIRIAKDVYVFSAGPSRQIELTRDLGVYRIIKGGQVDWPIDPA